MGLNRIRELCENGFIFARPTGKVLSQLAFRV
jgi:hypothetical protein